MKAKEAKEDKVDLKNIEWDLNYLQAAQKPFPLDEAYMQKLAGDYGPRQITIKDGRLFYFRVGGTAAEWSSTTRAIRSSSLETTMTEGPTKPYGLNSLYLKIM